VGMFQCKRAAAQYVKDRERAHDVVNANRDGTAKNKDKDIPKVFVFCGSSTFICVLWLVAYWQTSDIWSRHFWSVKPV